MATETSRAARDASDEALSGLAQNAVGYLASFDRPSASDGERRGAEWIAARLREEGCEATVEEERAHGTYWWPLGLMTLLAGLAGLLRSRRGKGVPRRCSSTFWASSGSVTQRRRTVP